MRRDLVDRAKVRIPLGRRDVAMAHDLLSNRFGFPQLREERGGGMPQRVEGHAVTRTAVGEPGTFRRLLQSSADGLDGTLPVFHDEGVRPEPGIVEDRSQLFADRHDLGPFDLRRGLVPSDGDVVELSVDVLSPRQRQHARQS